MIKAYPEDCLLKQSSEIDIDEYNLRTLRKELSDVQEGSFNAVAVAAPQVGENVRAFFYSWEGVEKLVVNPVITAWSKDYIPAIEGCLSLKGWYFKVYRPKQIVVRYTDFYGKDHKEMVRDPFVARIFLHEIDHLNGTLIPFYMNDLEFERWESYYEQDKSPAEFKTGIITASMV